MEHSHLPKPEEVFRSKVLSDQSTIATVRLVDGRTVAKYGRKVFVQEANAMILAASIGVPVPEVYGAYRYNERTFIFMAFVPGETLELAWDGMTAEQKDRLILDLRETLASLRKLTSTYVGGVNRAPCGDPLFMSHPHVGPFENVSEFCDGLFGNFLHVARGSAHSHRYLRRLLRRYEQYPIVFTHGDLSPRNIIVGDDHTLRAIIDWEMSGFMPAPWEWVKAEFGSREMPAEWFALMDRWLEPYDKEALMDRRFRISLG
ncbi:kinase-like protein [Atractiella rhizophila]|nr:kinase-like protein [Atractiella rhizophila]